MVHPFNEIWPTQAVDLQDLRTCSEKVRKIAGDALSYGKHSELCAP